MSGQTTPPADDPLQSASDPLTSPPEKPRSLWRRKAVWGAAGVVLLVVVAALSWRLLVGSREQDAGAMVGTRPYQWTPDFEWAEPVLASEADRPAAGLDDLLQIVGELTPSLNSPALLREMAWDGGPWGDLRQRDTQRPEPWRRWEIRLLEGHTLETYARQLDFFGIELGVLEPGGRIVYVFNLSQARPATRVGEAAAERRCYLTWHSGALRRADEELLARAKVDAKGKVILKFLPPAVERRLAELEQAEAGADLSRVERTCFGIRAAGSGYEFFVYKQTFRR